MEGKQAGALAMRLQLTHISRNVQTYRRGRTPRKDKLKARFCKMTRASLGSLHNRVDMRRALMLLTSGQGLDLALLLKTATCSEHSK